MTVFEEVAEKVVVEYKKNLTKKLQMVDAFIAFTVATGVVQVLLTSYNIINRANQNMRFFRLYMCYWLAPFLSIHFFPASFAALECLLCQVCVDIHVSSSFRFNAFLAYIIFQSRCAYSYHRMSLNMFLQRGHLAIS